MEDTRWPLCWRSCGGEHQVCRIAAQTEETDEDCD